jgi:hypothetical protein
MTEVEKKALGLFNEFSGHGAHNLDEVQHNAAFQALCYVLDVSHFTIAKPDPLVEAVKDILDEESLHNAEEFSDAIREALAKRGLEIREKE